MVRDTSPGSIEADPDYTQALVQLMHSAKLTNTWIVRFCGIVLLTGFLVAVGYAQDRRNEKDPAESKAELAWKTTRDRAEKLLAEMTLEEKAGQLELKGGLGDDPRALELQIARGLVGATGPGFARGPELANHLQRIAVEKSRLHIPLLFGLDVIHGHHTVFPVPLALAGSFDPGLIEATARIAAAEARNDGVNWVYSPMLDIARDARWGRITESAGEDPYLGAAVAAAYVRGYQGKSLADPDSVAVSVKHYAAYGGAEAGRDYNTVEMSDRLLRSVYLPPYEAAVKAGAATVMSAFNPLNGVPATANHYTLTEILRGEWGFNGFVVSDAEAIKELKAHGVALDDAGATLRAISAGVDMDMNSNYFGRLIPDLVRSGRLPQAVLDEAVRRVLRVKLALGLFEHPYRETPKPYAANPENRALAKRAAQESLVLLKNDPSNGAPLLPLAKTVKKVALIGPMANARGQMLGSWAFGGSFADVISLREALARRIEADGGSLIYAKGTELMAPGQEFELFPTVGEVGEFARRLREPDELPRLDNQSGFSAAVEAAKQADVVIMALGEDSALSGEAASRTRLDLPNDQQALLEAVAGTGKPVILVLFNGHPLALPWAAGHIPAILEAWFPGVECGNAITDVLFGDANPSGHLSVSLPRSVGQEPLYYNQLPTGRPPVGIDLSHPPARFQERWYSRYLDEQNSAQFPFGWGLSYTTFSFSDPAVSHPTISAVALRSGSAAPVRISAEVRNTGHIAGDAVVQLYLRVTGSSVEMPVRELKGFRRIHLLSGASSHVEFSLGYNELSFLDKDAKRVVEPVHYDVWIGDSSLATAHAEFSVQ